MKHTRDYVTNGIKYEFCNKGGVKPRFYSCMKFFKESLVSMSKQNSAFVTKQRSRFPFTSILFPGYRFLLFFFFFLLFRKSKNSFSLQLLLSRMWFFFFYYNFFSFFFVFRFSVTVYEMNRFLKERGTIAILFVENGGVIKIKM